MAMHLTVQELAEEEDALSYPQVLWSLVVLGLLGTQLTGCAICLCRCYNGIKARMESREAQEEAPWRSSSVRAGKDSGVFSTQAQAGERLGNQQDERSSSSRRKSSKAELLIHHERDVRTSRPGTSRHEKSPKRGRTTSREEGTVGRLPLRHKWGHLLEVKPNTEKPSVDIEDFVKGKMVNKANTMAQASPAKNYKAQGEGGKLMKEALQLARDPKAIEQARRRLCHDFTSSSSRRAKEVKRTEVLHLAAAGRSSRETPTTVDRGGGKGLRSLESGGLQVRSTVPGRTQTSTCRGRIRPERLPNQKLSTVFKSSGERQRPSATRTRSQGGRRCREQAEVCQAQGESVTPSSPLLFVGNGVDVARNRTS